jgi:hypothetical protein
VHYNANERHVALLGEGLPVLQQANYSPAATNSDQPRTPLGPGIMPCSRPCRSDQVNLAEGMPGADR